MLSYVQNQIVESLEEETKVKGLSLLHVNPYTSDVCYARVVNLVPFWTFQRIIEASHDPLNKR